MSIKPVCLRIDFDDFARRLPSGVDRQISERRTDYNGNRWSVDLLSLGGWINLYLSSKNPESLEVKYMFEVKDAEGETVEKRDLTDRFESNRGFDKDADSRGCEQLIKHSTILDEFNNILHDGALCVMVTIQVKDKDNDVYDPKATERLQDKMLELLKNEETADISTHVGQEVFHVHSLILDNNAPKLADYCRSFDGSNDDAIGKIDAEVFRLILEYVYAGYLPETKDEILAFGKELLDASNLFELVEFKHAIENVLVQERIINKENVCEYIIIADALSCFLLKEYAISYFLLHAKEILNSDNSKALRESGELLIEIMKIMADQDGLTLNELRKKLSKRGLDVDGSKQALISRLEEAKRQRTESDGDT